MKRERFGPLVAHGSYTMNLCSANSTTRASGLEMLEKDLRLMETFPGNLYNFHPGAHTGQGTETGIRLISEALNRVLWPEMRTTVLLETMAGKGSEIGGNFEELKEIIDRVECKGHIGVCFDTWDAGYDLLNDLDGVLTRFDQSIGLDRLKAVHFNDSKNECGSHKDRHEKPGQGRIGMNAMQRIALHPALLPAVVRFCTTHHSTTNIEYPMKLFGLSQILRNECRYLNEIEKRNPTFSWFFCHFSGVFPSISIKSTLSHSGVVYLSCSGVFFYPKLRLPFFVPLRRKGFRKMCSWRDSKEQLCQAAEEYQNAHSFSMFWIAVSPRKCYTLLYIAISTFDLLRRQAIWLLTTIERSNCLSLWNCFGGILMSSVQ